MKDIDFLPNRFRESGRQRRAMAWRIAAFGAVAAAFAALHYGQFSVRRGLDNDLKQVRLRFPLAVTETARLLQLQTELSQSQQFAELYTYLRHPWPRTQLIGGVTQPLPPEITLREIRIAPSLIPPTAGAPPASTPEGTAELPAPLKDLSTLRGEHDRNVTEVVVVGTTTDLAALQKYVACFANSAFFATARLHSLESLDSPRSRESRFEMRLNVRPGYGQPGGPGSPPTATAQAKQTGVEGTTPETRS